MPDLAKAYFERDLTEAEEQLLADQIASSPEAALKLAKEARSYYAATGLPSPDWGSTAAGAATASPGILKIVLLGVLLTGTALYFLSRPSPRALPAVEPPPAPVAVPARTGKTVPVRHSAPQVSRPAPTLAPQRLVPGRRYEGLAVIVEQKAAGLVTVRVLDGNGEEVRLLYAGLLPPGDWTFEWDGHLQDGGHAPGGLYTVETQSGKTQLQKKISIDPR
jgi:hypothetical protein